MSVSNHMKWSLPCLFKWHCMFCLCWSAWHKTYNWQKSKSIDLHTLFQIESPHCRLRWNGVAGTGRDELAMLPLDQLGGVLGWISGELPWKRVSWQWQFSARGCNSYEQLICLTADAWRTYQTRFIFVLTIDQKPNVECNGICKELQAFGVLR